MPKITSPGEFVNPSAIGPRLEFVPVPTPVFPAALDPSGGAAPSWTSNLIVADGYYNLILGVTLTRSGTLKVQRYIDDAGLIPIGAADSVNLTANTAGVLKVNDDVPFGSYTIEIANTDATGGHTAVISNFAIRAASN